MQNFWFPSIMLCGMVCIAAAAVSTSMPSTNPEYPNKCWDEHNKIAYEVGVHYPKDSCMQIQCDSDYSFSQMTCGTVAPPSGYRNEQDLTKAYPGCCVKLVKE